MNNILEIFKNLLVFDIIFCVIMAYSIIQCWLKGFSLSFMSFLKWILSLISTIIFVPKIQPWVNEYIESGFINSIGLGIFIFVVSLFILIILGKSMSRAVTWTGLGSVDKSFGLLFGFFKGYIISVCLFSIFNWFYPYQNWGISTEEAISFNMIKKGSEILVQEFPNNEDIIDTKEKIEKI
jgi:membrane protein required for colicin V production